MHGTIREFEGSHASSKPNLFKRILALLVTILSSPKGDQGGWEGGARGL